MTTTKKILNISFWPAFLGFLLALTGCQIKQPVTPSDICIIPKPLSLQQTGAVFTINSDTRIIVPGNTERCEQLAGSLNEIISKELNVSLPVVSGVTDKSPRNAIIFAIIPESEMQLEAYKL